jgi:gamma-glutamyltranspeptidase/glutathione hydrolase
VLGTPGGDDQDQYTNQTLLNVILFGMEVQAAIDAPKVITKHFPSLFFPHTAAPGQMNVNDRIPVAIRDELTARGHKITLMNGMFTDATTMLMYNPETKVISGGASPARDKQYVIGW